MGGECEIPHVWYVKIKTELSLVTSTQLIVLVFINRASHVMYRITYLLAINLSDMPSKNTRILRHGRKRT